MKPIPLAALLLLTGCASPPASPGMFQPERPRTDGGGAPVVKAPVPVKVDADLKAAAIKKGIEVILKLQQGKDNAEWPYEGVYRVGGQIPWGYRVGGTAICTMALVEAPGYAEDKARQEAVARAVKFICESKDEKDMAVTGFDPRYDVRCWGHIEAVHTLCRMKQEGVIPAGQEKAVDELITTYLDWMQKLEEPKTGGWNYASPQSGAPSTFMTSSALQALFEAAKAGYKVDGAVVTRGLEFLDKARAASGAVMYAGVASPKSGERASDGVPGSVGRMCSSEATLLLAGKGSLANVRGAVDAFIVHWEWLDKRRAQQGTHVAPYMIAPYYFMFAHYYAAEAVELLPKSEREEYRRHINELLFSVRREDGSWDDRVFERTSAYSTAMAMMAIMAPDRPAPARWDEKPGKEAAK